MSAVVLVIGATGVFGSRLVERLAISCDVTILVAGRSTEKIDVLISALTKRSLMGTLKPCVLDRDRVAPDALRALGVRIVIDAAGPFQGQDLRLPRSAIEAGCHFIDLADARHYVASFASLDAAARTAGVLAVCGASSTPAISHAALDHLAAELPLPEEVSIYISPGNRAPRGLSVVAAILSYVGQPVRVHEEGLSRSRAGWSLLHRRRLRDLSSRWFSLCETPDLDLIPARFASARTAKFYAGLELDFLHCGLWLLSWLVRMRLVRSLASAAVVLHRVAGWFEPFGTDRGGMLVEASGHNTNGAPLVARWGLVAESGDGPYIPVLPAIALIRKLLEQRKSRVGAQPCVGILSLEEITREFEGLRIQTYREVIAHQSLFAKVMGESFDQMPSAMRAFHNGHEVTQYRGVAHVEGAATLFGAFVARAFGFPSASANCPVDVMIAPRGQHEVWHRTFAGKMFRSRLDPGPRPATIIERFGPFRFLLKIVGDRNGLSMEVESAKVGILPMPRFLFPWTIAHERIDDQGRFTFDVEIGLAILGRIVRYRGWLQEPARTLT